MPEIAAALIAEMTRRYAGASETVTPENRVVLDPDEVDALRALGYVVP